MKYIVRDNSGAIARRAIWIYGRVWHLIVRCFVSFDKEGLAIEKFNKPCIIVVNHRSFFDTYCMNMLPVMNICFAVRAWPFKIVIYSLFMIMAEYLNIESETWDKVRELAGNRLKNGNNLLFFPEGHRSRDGKLTRFYSGAFKLSLEFNVPVIPICLTGTGTLFPPGRFWVSPSKIVIKGLDPVYPDQFQGEMAHIDFKKHVKKLMNTNLNEMDDIDLKL